MTKQTPNLKNKPGRPELPKNLRRYRVSCMITQDMIEYINKQIELGKATTVSSWIYLALKKYINDQENNK